MITSIHGYRTRTLKFLGPVLETWIEIVTQFAKAWQPYNDVPWDSTERSFLSLLAGAIWKQGGACFEEFSDKKRRRDSGVRHYLGRVDLYFMLRKCEFTVEAKSTWSGISRNDNRTKGRLVATLERACEDVRLSRPYEENRRLGVLFAMPYIREDYEHQTNEKLLKWITIIGQIETGACAWVFPACTRYFRIGGYIYPGMTMLIKELKK